MPFIFSKQFYIIFFTKVVTINKTFLSRLEIWSSITTTLSLSIPVVSVPHCNN